MKEIYEALVTDFDANASLIAMFPNGLLNDVGYDHSVLPICIVSGISEVPSYTTCTVTNDLVVQFSVFASTADQCFDAMALIKAEFDEHQLSLVDASPIRVERVSTTPPRKIEDAWRITLDYRILTQE